MKKIFIYICIIITVFSISFYLGYKIKKQDSNIESEEIKPYLEVKETVAEDEKIGPNAKMIMKTLYEKCSHMKKEELEVPKELVNLTRDEIKEKYPDWEIEDFSVDKVILKKNVDGYCGEHYILKENNGYIVVYTIDENNNEKKYLSTEIAVVYLPETDQVNLKKGIIVYSKKDLIELLQDFE